MATNNALIPLQEQLNGVLTVTRQLGVTALQSEMDATFMDSLVRTLALLESMKVTVDIKVNPPTMTQQSYQQGT